MYNSTLTLSVFKKRIFFSKNLTNIEEFYLVVHNTMQSVGSQPTSCRNVTSIFRVKNKPNKKAA
jgi:hypothetical protein